jgi:hypothetical protein
MYQRSELVGVVVLYHLSESIHVRVARLNCVLWRMFSLAYTFLFARVHPTDITVKRPGSMQQQGSIKLGQSWVIYAMNAGITKELTITAVLLPGPVIDRLCCNLQAQYTIRKLLCGVFVDED